jgi:hypothetical protein
MTWFYHDGSQQTGPVSDAQLDELLRLGKISPTTMVWCEGMKDWQPLNVARGGTSLGVVCVECGKTFQLEDTIKLNNSIVCAQCKPIFLQRMAESAVMPSTGSLWRSNKRLVARTETVFPDRCVKCNAPANGFQLKRTLYWMHPAFYLLILCNLLVLLIVHLIVRKKAVMHIGLCEQHRSKRKLGLIIGWGSFALGIVLFICAAIFSSGWYVLAGFAAILGGGITGGVMARTLSATKIDKEYAWMAGAHKEFLAELPEWSGP